MMRKATNRRASEPTIALINIVFLMLIFFMVAGTLAPPLDPDLKLVDTKTLEGRDPPNALVMTADGALRFRGQTVDGPEPYLATLNDRSQARVVPDRAAPAADLIALAQRLKAAGAEQVFIVSERAQ